VSEREKIVIPGGAGLVGFNLVAALLEGDDRDIVVIDKHRENLALLGEVFPAVLAVEADLGNPGDWGEHFQGATAVVMLQAQIGSNDKALFERNNVTATRNILEACRHCAVPYLVHISSSVVESVADDLYTRSKTEQEQLVQASGIDCAVLRPTLMFGWFDRKHLGWLSRFMGRVPVFPIPGHGRYARQPLYVGDLCQVIVACIKARTSGITVNISGREKVDYVDIIRAIKRATNSKSMILPIPYRLFSWLLSLWALFDSDPPFTVAQLSALVQDESFEVVNWPAMFGVQATPFERAIESTFRHPVYSRVHLKF
jgi:nucleoside-diphosphate-sugar epimerase